MIWVAIDRPISHEYTYRLEHEHRYEMRCVPSCSGSRSSECEELTLHAAEWSRDLHLIAPTLAREANHC